MLKGPTLSNLWLTAQGDKIPPAQCVGPQGSTDTSILTEGLSVPITSVDPKGSGNIVDLGAFEFEVKYDPKLVCVEITPGHDTDVLKMMCVINDSTNSLLEGLARIGCITKGKALVVDGVWSLTLDSALAGHSDCVGVINEQPDLTSSLIPLAATGKGSQSGSFECVGASPVFGWIAVPALSMGNYDNETGVLSAVIPCSAESQAAELCTADGTVDGTFTDNHFEGTGFIIGFGPGGALDLEFAIAADRIGRKVLDDLATITVRPQPEAYSQIRANQDNGMVAQLLNQNCQLADQQGHALKLFSCGDADVTIRYLEGDVNPDCAVDALDQQAVAFRWGAGKGSLLYQDRFDLEPSGAVKGDGDVDISDLQFVFGRHGSTCDNPHPVQDPANPKGLPETPDLPF